MTESDNPIEKIRARLDGGNKWLKGDLFKEGTDRVCLLGAAQLTQHGKHGSSFRDLAAVPHLMPVLEAQYPERTAGAGLDVDWARVANFNDHADTEWSDVELVLDKASLAWEEGRAAS